MAVHEAANVRLLEPSGSHVRLGPYQLERLIGCGGMGIVFQARDPDLDRPVALKLWNLDAEEAELALRNEAQCQAQVSHPNVVTIYETGKIGDDVYLAMEYVDGKDVRRWLGSRKLAWQEIVALFIRAGQGLAAVHQRGLVHGDFKPENILLGRDGRVLVADFGLARAVGETKSDRASGKFGGTRVYMAPEQLEGRVGSERSDQFSFCVALWECIHGVRPHAGADTAQLLDAIARGSRRAGPAAVLIPRQLRRLIGKGLAADPAERWESMSVLVGELSKIPTRLRRRRLACVVGALGLVALTVVELPNLNEPISKHEIPHEGFGIIADPPTTIEREAVRHEPETKSAPVSEIFVLIHAGDFDSAIDIWRNHRRRRWASGESSEQLSLAVATLLHTRAVELVPTNPSAAIVAARHAHLVATSIPVDPPVTDKGRVAAEEIQTATYKLVMELAEQFD